MQFSIADLQEIGHEVRDDYMETSDVDLDWPDCYDISYSLKKHFVDEYEVDESLVTVERYFIDHPSLDVELHHYALVVDAQLAGESIVIDASFDQFAEETETAVGIAERDKIEPVVVVPREKYVFED